MGLNITVLQLETFQAVIESGSMVDAANKLYTSQSSVSKTLTRLEENLGFSLFERQRGKLILTDAGKYFYEKTNAILKELNQSILHGRSIANSKAHVFNVAGSTYLLEDIAVKFHASVPAAHMNIHFYPEGYLPNILTSQEADLAISTDKSLYPSSAFNWEPIMSCRLMCVVDKKHPLAPRQSILLQDILGETVVCNNIGVSSTFIRNLFTQNRLTPPNILECNDRIFYTDMMNDAHRITIIPTYAVLAESNPAETKEIPILNKDAVQHFGLAFLRSDSPSWERETFIDCSLQYCRTLSDRIVQLEQLFFPN